MILLLSVFRNSERYVDRYAEQVAKLRVAADESLHTIAVEGDSDDTTWDMLVDCPEVDTILKCEHGGEMFGSVIHPQRWRQLSVACNVALAAACRLSTPDTVTVYMESDLMWDAETVLALTDDLKRVDAIAPMSMQGARFYDIWGYTQHGERFNAHPPFYRDLGTRADGLVPIDTSGSCFAVTHDALLHIEFSAIDCIRGIGRTLAANGHTLWLDPSLRVEHPRDDSQ